MLSSEQNVQECDPEFRRFAPRRGQSQHTMLLRLRSGKQCSLVQTVTISDLKPLNILRTIFKLIQIHLYKKSLYATCFGGGKKFLPVNNTLANGYLFFVSCPVG